MKKKDAATAVRTYKAGLLCLAVLVALAYFCIRTVGIGTGRDTQNPDTAAVGMTVHYLDVGKCSCALVCSSDGRFMLIDAGSNDEEHSQKIVSYLEGQGVRTLDYLLLTHPHKDHIRAVPQILDYFTVKTVLMGNFSRGQVGTKTFGRLLDALEAKKPVRIRPQPGETYALGNVSFTVLAHDDSPETAREEMNDCSIALMLTDGFHRFLFYGDGEEGLEERMVESGADLSCDVLTVAHHGGKSSTKKKLLEAAQPDIAVISCGIDEDGIRQVPSKKTLKRLQERNVEIYRTDRDGTVVLDSTQEEIRVR